jgi:hypothetical protein
MLFTPLLPTESKAVEVSVAHPLAHACIRSSRPWITEGLAHLAQALVRERQEGRKAALDYMQQFRPALAAAEKEALEPPPGATNARPEGEPLTRTGDDIYRRFKAMFVWWMLRDMIGDEPLQRALHNYRASEDKEPSYVQRLIEAQAKRSLEWFFDDWVYRDRGLPDFRISSASSRTLLPESVSVSITIENNGDAAAETPIALPVGKGEAMQRLFVPARGKATTRITSPSIPAEVVVNDGSVPESDMNNNVFKLSN